MGVLSNKISREDLKAGDHIYSWRQAYVYAHHGQCHYPETRAYATDAHWLGYIVKASALFSLKKNGIIGWYKDKNDDSYANLGSGIYIGEGRVIHFTRGAGQEVGTGTFLDHIFMSSSPSRSSENPCPNCGDQSRVDGVMLSCIDCFLSGGDLYKFEYGVTPAFFLAKARGGTCTLAQSDSPEDVLHRASFLLEKGFGGYNVFKNNCEDFAIYCKTGLLVFTNISVGRSGQAGSILAAASAIVSSPLRYLTTSFSGLAAVGFSMYCVSRFVSDVGVRRDVSKIPVERLVSASILDEPEASTSTSKKM